MTHTERKHFEVLDGLRGMAALAVVIFHFAEIIAPDSSHNFIGHGFLAVDFFFCLSGFVIAYAYDDRIASLGLALYMTHYWVMWMFGDYMNRHRPAGTQLLGIVLGIPASQLILAWLVMVLYDIPVRRALSRQFLLYWRNRVKTPTHEQP